MGGAGSECCLGRRSKWMRPGRRRSLYRKSNESHIGPCTSGIGRLTTHRTDGGPFAALGAEAPLSLRDARRHAACRRGPSALSLVAASGAPHCPQARGASPQLNEMDVSRTKMSFTTAPKEGRRLRRNVDCAVFNPKGCAAALNYPVAHATAMRSRRLRSRRGVQG